MFIFHFCRTKHKPKTKSAVSNQKSRHKAVTVRLRKDKYNPKDEEKQLESKKYHVFYVLFIYSFLNARVKETGQKCSVE